LRSSSTTSTVATVRHLPSSCGLPGLPGFSIVSGTALAGQ
jgi:hypothetical protein